ncbi:Acetyltransferase (GNAT) domain-containing protein [Novosphingobium sp. CF614]|uniref:GNAT family N-acetyltransferase n=1 Tax=Novosphingobium sp. CF614 TaxID=1884364 RepID=UPI0008F30CFB|nr:GNAT family N-acetyltransferase [Novosphingobium sp. CF614]SFG03677.1 Acetyltransferase (GNAT) domain-containing protein [Novosphingobium sp. CF614]
MPSEAMDEIAPSVVDAETACAHLPSSKLTCVPWRELEDDVGAWDGLALRAAEPNPFFESWYLLPSLRNLPGTERVMVLRFEQDGQLSGILPIVRAGRYYRWPVPQLSSWLHANSFCGVPLVARGCEVPFWQAALRWADAAPGAALFLHLRGMVLGGPMHAALAGVIACEGRKVEVVHREARAMLASSLSPEAYLEASLSGKKRKELRRQASRLTEQGQLAFERRNDIAEIDEWCRQFLALEAAGWKGKAGSALACDQANARLFRESLEGAAARGRLERLTLRLDGRPLAMLATFLTPPGAFSYKTTFDENFARFSPGVLLQRENLAMLERPEIAWSDSCASADHPMIDHFWRERRGIGRLSIAIGGRLRRTAFSQFVRAETARSPATVER